MEKLEVEKPASSSSSAIIPESPSTIFQKAIKKEPVSSLTSQEIIPNKSKKIKSSISNENLVPKKTIKVEKTASCLSSEIISENPSTHSEKAIKKEPVSSPQSSREIAPIKSKKETSSSVSKKNLVPKEMLEVEKPASSSSSAIIPESPSTIFQKAIKKEPVSSLSSQEIIPNKSKKKTFSSVSKNNLVPKERIEVEKPASSSSSTIVSEISSTNSQKEIKKAPVSSSLSSQEIPNKSKKRKSSFVSNENLIPKKMMKVGKPASSLSLEIIPEKPSSNSKKAIKKAPVSFPLSSREIVKRKSKKKTFSSVSKNNLVSKETIVVKKPARSSSSKIVPEVPSTNFQKEIKKTPVSSPLSSQEIVSKKSKKRKISSVSNKNFLPKKTKKKSRKKLFTNSKKAIKKEPVNYPQSSQEITLRRSKRIKSSSVSNKNPVPKKTKNKSRKKLSRNPKKAIKEEPVSSPHSSQEITLRRSKRIKSSSVSNKNLLPKKSGKKSQKKAIKKEPASSPLSSRKIIPYKSKKRKSSSVSNKNLLPKKTKKKSRKNPSTNSKKAIKKEPVSSPLSSQENIPNKSKKKTSSSVSSSHIDNKRNVLFEESGVRVSQFIEPATSTPPKKIGFLGLRGIDCRCIVKLLREGHTVSIWDTIIMHGNDTNNFIVKEGAKNVLYPANVIQESDLTFCCLYDEKLNSVFFGKFGVMEELDRRCNNKAVIQLSYINPDTSQEIGKAIARKGGKYLGAPMISATHNFNSKFVVSSGDEDVFHDCYTVFAIWTKELIYLGKDFGAAMKDCNRDQYNSTPTPLSPPSIPPCRKRYVGFP